MMEQQAALHAVTGDVRREVDMILVDLHVRCLLQLEVVAQQLSLNAVRACNRRLEMTDNKLKYASTRKHFAPETSTET